MKQTRSSKSIWNRNERFDHFRFGAGLGWDLMGDDLAIAPAYYFPVHLVDPGLDAEVDFRLLHVRIIFSFSSYLLRAPIRPVPLISVVLNDSIP